MKNKNFVISRISSDKLMLSKDDLVSHVQGILNQVEKEHGRVIFVVSAIPEAIKILNTLFNFWEQKHERSKSCVWEYFKNIHIKTCARFDFPAEILSQLFNDFKKLELLLNKEVRCENLTKDQAQVLVFGELLASFIFFEFIRINFPETTCFLGDSGNLIGVDLNTNDSYVDVISNGVSMDDFKVLLHVNNGHDSYIFQNSIARDNNWDPVILKEGLFSIFSNDCSSLGQVKII
jgi:hypothetical protein